MRRRRTASIRLDLWLSGNDKKQREAIASARFVANPGCYPTAFIALVRPLIEANLVPRDWPYRSMPSRLHRRRTRMIAEFEDETSGEYTQCHAGPMRCRARTSTCRK